MIIIIIIIIIIITTTTKTMRSKIEQIFVSYSRSFVFHLYSFIVYNVALEICEIMHGDYLAWKLNSHPV